MPDSDRRATATTGPRTRDSISGAGSGASSPESMWSRIQSAISEAAQADATGPDDGVDREAPLARRDEHAQCGVQEQIGSDFAAMLLGLNG